VLFIVFHHGEIVLFIICKVECPLG
jgi:hypothetical protein